MQNFFYTNSWIRKKIALSYIIQYRIKYSLKKNTNTDRVKCIWSNILKFTEQFQFSFVRELIKSRKFIILDLFRGLNDGMKYVKSNYYQEIPAFDAYIKKQT